MSGAVRIEGLGDPAFRLGVPDRARRAAALGGPPWAAWGALGGAGGPALVLVPFLAAGRQASPGEIVVLALAAARALLVAWIEGRPRRRGMIAVTERRDRVLGRARMRPGPGGIDVEDRSGRSRIAWAWADDVRRVSGGPAVIGGLDAIPVSEAALRQGIDLVELRSRIAGRRGRAG